MKILLINPKIKLFYKPMTSPLGLMSIATYLNANGHQTIISDRFFEKESICGILNDFKPDIVGVSVITNRFIEDAIEVSRQVKDKNIPVVWGGPMASEIPVDILKSGVVDYICFSEGEETWLEMVDAMKKGKSFEEIKGIGYLKNDLFVKTSSRDFVDLKTLPPLDWSLIDVEKYFQPYYQSKRMLYMYSSKGCIGNCTFCYNAQFHKSKHRTRCYDHVYQEIQFLVENYGLDGVNFSDDLMFCNRNQVVDFCEGLIENNINIFWGGNLRVGIINNEEDFKLMHKAGCRWLLIGVETGSKRMQKNICKNIPYDKIVNTFNCASKSGIISIAPFMIGLPGETAEDLIDTVEMAKKLNATVCIFNFFTPIPGTKIYDDLIEDDKYIPLKNIEEHSKLYFGEKLKYNLSDVDSKELKAIWSYFQLRSLFFKNEFKDAFDNNPLIIKIIKNAIKSISGHGFFHFIQAGFIGVFDFLSSVYVLFSQPKIRKKYKLYFKKV